MGRWSLPTSTDGVPVAELETPAADIVPCSGAAHSDGLVIASQTWARVTYEGIVLKDRFNEERLTDGSREKGVAIQ